VIAVADYGAGNLHSIGTGLRRRGLQVRITEDPRALDDAAALVVPGDGAFGPAMARLRTLGFAERIVAYIRSGRPVLGVCLGMQVLFDESEEGGALHPGLGVLPGRVVRVSATVKAPHMGWNRLRVQRPSPLLEGVPSGAYVYFLHSYHCASTDPALVAATVSYGGEIAAVAGRGSVWATQFHPEKSGAVGARILDNFARWAAGVGAAGR
jgi:imidazole glycerol-phosphate synthase subunit HisH